MSAVTQWFKGATKPVHVGVYERITGIDKKKRYSYWDGSTWSFLMHTVEGACNFQGCSSRFQSCPWRGLAKRPEEVAP